MRHGYGEEMKINIIKSILGLLVLNVLKNGPICGNEIVAELEKRFNVYVSPSMMYSLLNRLKEQDVICYHSLDANKKSFALTEVGDNVRKGHMRSYNNFNELLSGWLNN